jgi:triacylglycerol esterase/lipase EstA (alpha/beta hydrolase family)
MLARILRIVTLAWAVALAIALSRGPARGWTGGCVAVAAALLLAHPALLLAESLLMLAVTRAGGGEAIPLARLLRAWAGEWAASTRVFGWRMPWRERAQPDHLPPAAQGRRGVVLVHGYVCNRALWNPLMARLRGAGHPFVALTLEPVFGTIEGYVAQLDDAVARLQSITGRQPVVVAHSMGGLVARAWLASRGDAVSRVASLVTIGTPHRGTWLARFGVSPNARQMRIDGEWLAGLAAATRDGSAARFTCWWSECDQVVYPPPVALLPGAVSRPLQGVGHVALSQRPEIAEDLLRRLAG